MEIETGRLARQAHGSVTVRAGGTMVLVTATCSDKPREDIDFLPLIVDYEERLYAAGKIPGSFFKREGRPSESSVLICRLIDRGLRPLFPPGYRNDVQIIAIALSSDGENPIDVLAMNGAAAALALSGIPMVDLCASMRIGMTEDGEFIVYPTVNQYEEGPLDLIVSATRDSITMVEVAAKEVDERLVVSAMRHGIEWCHKILDMIDELKQAVGSIPERESHYFTVGDDVREAVANSPVLDRVREALEVRGKIPQRQALAKVREEIVAQFAEQFPGRELEIGAAVDEVVKNEIRRQILEEGRRPDGRAPDEMRELRAEVGIAPRAHGTGLFERGETQVLCTATLGMLDEAQRLDGIIEEEDKTFMHHYNMPPFSTGEAYPIRGPSRRAIGHGALAERALRQVMPTEEEFPYTVRLVSEALGSDGSTSMASVTAGCLALMDAGVPIKAAVAGVAMGIIMEEDRHVILTDIQALEDFNGDMDFKVAGTREGVTAIQLDVKKKGLTPEVLAEALEQARLARFRILDKMEECLPAPRPELSPWAPRIYTIEIPVDKIGAVIGPGGKCIRKVEQLGVRVDIEEDGKVYVAASDPDIARRAVEMIEAMAKDPKPGEVYIGRVTRILPFGAFLEILPGKEGMLHVSQYSWDRISSIDSVLKVGDELRVKVTEIDEHGRINLSRKELLERPVRVNRGSRPSSVRRRGGRGKSRGVGGSSSGSNVIRARFREKR